MVRLIGLQVISATEHRFAGSDKFVRDRYAVEPAVEFLFFTLDEAGQESQSQILIAARNFRRTGSCINYLFTNGEESIKAIAVNKFGVFVSGIGFENRLPRGRGKFETVFDFLVRVESVARARPAPSTRSKPE